MTTKLGRWCLIAMLASILVVGCGDGDDGADRLVRVKGFFGQRAEMPAAVTRIELNVSGEGMDDILEIIRVDELNPAEDVVFSLEVPSGLRLFEVVASGEDGFGLYRGRRQIQIEVGDDVDLDIELDGWGRVEGTIRYPDGSPLANYQETAFATEIETDGQGAYRVEAPSGGVSLRVQPADNAVAFATVAVSEPGQTVRADLVLIRPADRNQPWVSAVAPHTDLAPGQLVTVWGQGYSEGTNRTVWFGTPGQAPYGEITDVTGDVALRVAVPGLAPVSGSLFVCWTDAEDCSNGFAFTVE